MESPINIGPQLLFLPVTLLCLIHEFHFCQVKVEGTIFWHAALLFPLDEKLREGTANTTDRPDMDDF